MADKHSHGLPIVIDVCVVNLQYCIKNIILVVHYDFEVYFVVKTFI